MTSQFQLFFLSFHCNFIFFFLLSNNFYQFFLFFSISLFSILFSQLFLCWLSTFHKLTLHLWDLKKKIISYLALQCTPKLFITTVFRLQKLYTCLFIACFISLLFPSSFKQTLFLFIFFLLLPHIQANTHIRQNRSTHIHSTIPKQTYTHTHTCTFKHPCKYIDAFRHEHAQTHFISSSYLPPLSTHVASKTCWATGARTIISKSEYLVILLIIGYWLGQFRRRVNWKDGLLLFLLHLVCYFVVFVIVFFTTTFVIFTSNPCTHPHFCIATVDGRVCSGNWLWKHNYIKNYHFLYSINI